MEGSTVPPTKNLYERLGLPRTGVARAVRQLRSAATGDVYDERTRNTRIVPAGQSGIYRNGLQLIPRAAARGGAAKTCELSVWTVDDGVHVLSARLFVDAATCAHVPGGSVNCFALGMVPADAGYLEELLAELEAEEAPIRWDRILVDTSPPARRRTPNMED